MYKYHQSDDYAALNIIFSYRYKDEYNNINGNGRWSRKGDLAFGIEPQAAWTFNNSRYLERTSAVLVSSASLWPTEMGLNLRGRVRPDRVTLAHEVGHWLGLLHTDGADCSYDDKVSDTPVHVLNWDVLEFRPDGCAARNFHICSQYEVDPLDNIMTSRSMLVQSRPLDFAHLLTMPLLDFAPHKDLPRARWRGWSRCPTRSASLIGMRWKKRGHLLSSPPWRPPPTFRPPPSRPQPQVSRPAPVQAPQSARAAVVDWSRRHYGTGQGKQWIEGACASNADCATNCCAFTQPRAICSSPRAAYQDGKRGCGFEAR